MKHRLQIMRISVFVIATTILYFSFSGSFPIVSYAKDKSEEGKLDHFSEPYEEKNTSKKENVESHHYKNDDDDDSDNFFDDFIGEIFVSIFEAILITPFRDFGYRYCDYPYSDAMKKGQSIYIASKYQADKTVAFQSRTYYQSVDHNIKAIGLYGRILLPSSINIDIYNSHYWEKANGDKDSINYFTTHLNLASFTANTNTMLGIGVGGAYLTGTNSKTYDSISFQASADIFPYKPWSIQLSENYAKPAGKNIYNYRATVGYHIESLELFMGYNALRNSNGNILDGPIFGCALWF